MEATSVKSTGQNREPGFGLDLRKSIQTYFGSGGCAGSNRKLSEDNAFHSDYFRDPVGVV